MIPEPRGEVLEPGVARFILWLSASPKYRQDQLGDLAEGFRRRVQSRGMWTARMWYWRQSLRSLLPNSAVRARSIRRRTNAASSGDRKRNTMDTIIQDLRYGVRSLWKNPLFATLATLTLALAIGVNTAIFSLVNVVIFADLPMANPETAAVFRATNPQLGEARRGFTFREFAEFRDGAASFAGIAAWKGDQWVLTGEGKPIRVDGYRVTDNLFDVWGIEAIRGRPFLPGEERPGAAQVVIVSHGFWVREYGAREDLVGSTLRLDGMEYTVVGVMSPDMEFANLADVEIWVPLGLDRGTADMDERELFVTGRLLATASVESAQRDIAGIAAGLVEQFPSIYGGWEPRVLGAAESLLDDEARTILGMLVLTVAFVLLIACANIANMLLARATTRSREMAVRAALGAGRWRLTRQLLTESFVIALGASILGLGLSRALMQGLIAMTKGEQDLFLMATVDSNVLAFTLVVSLLAPLTFGLIPALRASSQDFASALKEGGARSGGGHRGGRIRGALVSTQLALAMMLMVVAGLMTRTVVKLQQRELGFDPAGVLTARVDLPDTKYESDDEIRRFYDAAVAGVVGVPAVQGVALASRRPAVFAGSNRPFEIEGRPVVEDSERPAMRVSVVDPRYLDLLGIPVVRGRGFGPEDDEKSVPVGLISQQAARRFWPDDDPLGRRVRLSDNTAEPWVTIVGIVADVRAADDTGTPEPDLLRPFHQAPRRGMFILAKASAMTEHAEAKAGALAGAVRGVVWDVDAEQPIGDVRTLERALYDEDSGAYALLTLFVAFAVFALAMAGIGIYGVMSYSVSQRSSEISIRIALGAKHGDVRGLVLRQGGKLLAIGTVSGLLGAVLLSRMLSSLVFGIKALDPVTFLGVPAVLVAVGVLANYLPARRAIRLDPMSVLRVE